jgi:hypothetical protein
MLPYKICILLLNDSQILFYIPWLVQIEKLKGLQVSLIILHDFVMTLYCICENHVYAWSPDMLWPTHAVTWAQSVISSISAAVHCIASQIKCCLLNFVQPIHLKVTTSNYRSNDESETSGKEQRKSVNSRKDDTSLRGMNTKNAQRTKPMLWESLNWL